MSQPTASMVERVAAAIIAALRASDPQGRVDALAIAGRQCIDGYFEMEAVARAAIEAMREPTATPHHTTEADE